MKSLSALADSRVGLQLTPVLRLAIRATDTAIRAQQKLGINRSGRGMGGVCTAAGGGRGIFDLALCILVIEISCQKVAGHSTHTHTGCRQRTKNSLMIELAMLSPRNTSQGSTHTHSHTQRGTNTCTHTHTENIEIADVTMATCCCCWELEKDTS